MAYQGPSIVDYLKSEGKDSSMSARKKLAGQYGITDYKGTAAQNTRLLQLLRQSSTAAEDSGSAAAPKAGNAPSGNTSPSGNASASGNAAAGNAGAAGNAPWEYEAPRPTYAPGQGLTALEQQVAAKAEGGVEPYTSPYEAQIQALLAQALNREPFTYDHRQDPLYAAYESSYMGAGKQAMEDTLASAAALTGGYGSSYAVTAGNQAYQSYLQELSALLPTLYDAAYRRYQDAGEDVLARLGLLQNLEGDAYTRYRDTVADHYQDLNHYYRQYQDMSEAQYAAYLADLEQWNLDRQYYYDAKQDAQAQANWQAEYDLAAAKEAASKAGKGGSGTGKTSAGKTAATSSGAVQSAPAGGVVSPKALEVLATVQKLYDPTAKVHYIEHAKRQGLLTKREAELLRAQVG